MCGILGVDYLDNESKLELVKRGISKISHRGPDNATIKEFDRVIFAHARLSLLDLSENGNQPFYNDSSILVYNGEIYNYDELKKTYLSDETFYSTSDTEVLFKLIQKRGIYETVNLIEGMFAFSYYNRIEKKHYLVRDRIGIKPLFYYYDGKEVVFSSELKAIIEIKNLKVDKLKVLSSSLGSLETTRIYTGFENVNQVEPGSIVEFDEHLQKKISNYFRTSSLVNEKEYAENFKLSKTQITDKFDDLLNHSIKKMLVSDAPMGAFVSGGIDSSLISSVAKKYRDINLYTANVVGKFSELKYAEIVAKHLNSKLYKYDYQKEFLIRDWVKTTWYYESPIVVHTNAIPFQGVAAMTFANKDKAVLTGEGADELFLGYPRLLTKKYDKIINLPINVVNSIYKKIPGLTRYLNLNKVNYSAELIRQPFAFEKAKLEEEYKTAYEFITDKEIKKNQVLTLSMIDNGLHSLLWRNDRMGMMHSIESRFPFLDENILKFAANLPLKFKISKTNKFYNYKHPFMIDKWIVREVAKRYLPSEIFQKPKVGFPIQGHMEMKFDINFFKEGFWIKYLDFDELSLKIMLQKTDKYLISKLASVEIWGRLFILNQSIEHVNKIVVDNCKFN